MRGRIYSIGYEGLTLGSFVDHMVQSRVVTVVDVRLNAASRRPGFSKKRLSAALEDAGISYVHEPLLGNPPDNREAFRREATRGVGRAAMQKRLENGSREAVVRLADRARTERVAVLCVERCSAECHREVVIDAVRDLVPALKVLPIL